MSLEDFTIAQLLDSDPRPTLAIALNSTTRDGDEGADAPKIRTDFHYANRRLVELAPLCQRLKDALASQAPMQRGSDSNSAEFKCWAAGRVSASSLTRCFAGYKWTRMQLGDAFCVLSADGTGEDDLSASLPHGPTEPPHNEALARSPHSCRHKSPLQRARGSGGANGCSRPSTSDDGSEPTPVLWLPDEDVRYNWTETALTEVTPDHTRRLRLMDWSATPLGPMEEWEWDLRAASDMLLRTPYPAAMYWGPEFVAIYNEPYIDLAGRKHPELLGTPYAKGWSEIWHLIEPVMLAAWSDGQSTMKHNDRLFIMRGGFLEETFFSWSLVPLLGSTGQVAGIFNAAFETTHQVINERRLQTLQEVGQYTATAKVLRDFWSLALKGMASNDADFPFCLIYSAAEDSNSDGSSYHSDGPPVSPVLTLEGSLGVLEGHPSAPAQLDTRGSEGFAPHMRQSMAIGGKPIVLSTADGTLPGHLIDGLDWLGFGEPSTAVVVFAVTPITPKTSPSDPPQSRGFVVLGVNPRRPYDSAYELFIQLLTRQLGTSLASVVLYDDQVKRSEREARLAALSHQELSLQLHQRTQEAVESEYKFARMAEYAPVGIFIADSQGRLTFCNGMWWQLSLQARISVIEDKWMENIVQADRAAVEDAWDKLVAQKTAVSLEFRFKSALTDQPADDTWVLMRAFPPNNNEDIGGTIFGCITDISAQKEAENVQRKRRQEAQELKRQQENFIDITSHEMRNPLSAILQCADQIIKGVAELDNYDDASKVKQLFRDNVEAANTINLCASHQKRIVDDILTLSKLDSKLMTINPVPTKPCEVVERVLAMFEPESIAHDIKLTLTVDESFSQHGIDTVSLDPSRLQQVLINLVTNAVKFTKGCSQRHIDIRLGAGTDDGRSLLPEGHCYVPVPATAGNNDVREHDEVPKSANGAETVCLHFTVQDSGPGLDEEDLELLFQRFQQSSPRTHVQYGGSGLGLFISRLLVDMMGGEIGVSSRIGSGSRFFFYIKCRRGIVSIPATPKPERALQPCQDAGSNPASYNILIVEDNLINQQVLKRQLLNGGHVVHTANHGQEALDVLAKSDAWRGYGKTDGVALSAILMDIEMPVMNGLECTRKIRELEATGIITRHLPIIAVTAYARPRQVDDAKVAGVDDVMPKPFRITELMPKIIELAQG